MSANGRGGDLEIIEELVLVALPRGAEELRVTFTRAKKPDGSEAAWHSLRVFWKSDGGEWRPGKQGISIRGGELAAIAVGLLRACASRIPQPLHAATKEIVAALTGNRAQQSAVQHEPQHQPPKDREPLPHEIYDQRAGRPPR